MEALVDLAACGIRDKRENVLMGEALGLLQLFSMKGTLASFR